MSKMFASVSQALILLLGPAAFCDLQSAATAKDSNRASEVSATILSIKKFADAMKNLPGAAGTLPNVPNKESSGQADVDFGPYMVAMQRRIKNYWFPPKDLVSKRVVTRFTVKRDGTVLNIKIHEASGSAEADAKALEALAKACPLPPLPEGAPDSVDMEFVFDYNVFGGGLDLVLPRYRTRRSYKRWK